MFFAAVVVFVMAMIQTLLIQRRKERIAQMPRLLSVETGRPEMVRPTPRRRFEGIPIRPTLTRR
jgi:hypothetical protein